MTIEGRWQMKTLQAQTKQQALLELAQLRVEAAERATLAQRPRGSVAAIAEAWLNSFALQVERGERSIRTLDYYRSNYRCHVETYFGSQRVDEVGPDEIVSFNDSLRADSKKGPRRARLQRRAQSHLQVRDPPARSWGQIAPA